MRLNAEQTILLLGQEVAEKKAEIAALEYRLREVEAELGSLKKDPGEKPEETPHPDPNDLSPPGR